jgi:excisionase family DNA binding protein
MTITRTTAFEKLPEWLRVPEYAAVMDISPWSVYEAIKRGDIRRVKKFGRCIRIHRDEVKDGVEQPALRMVAR